MSEAVIRPRTRAEWRAWLEQHHAAADAVWVEYRRAAARAPDLLTYDELVEEALCFGWIDGKASRGDEQHLRLRMSRRRPGGTWAASNKERVARLAAQGLMTPAGWAAVERAKADGSWDLLDAVEQLLMPADLAEAFASQPGTREGFDRLSPSRRQMILWAVVSAKRPATRAQRIERIVGAAARGLPPEEWLRADPHPAGNEGPAPEGAGV